MIVVWIIGALILLVVLLVCVVLVVPVRLAIDTDKAIYRVYQPGVFSVRLMPFELRIAGIKVSVSDTKHTEKRKKPKALKRKTRKVYSVDALKFLIRKVFGAIRVRKLEVDIDTDDFPLNAKLAPLFYFGSRGPCLLNVNFNGRNYVGVMASVRPISLVWAYLLFLTKK